MKHTKGPWTVGEESGIATGCIEIEGDLCPVAHVEKWDTLSETSQEEAEANALLIAAAPELLEALKNCVTDARQKLTRKERLKRTYHALHIIDKAEGMEF